MAVASITIGNYTLTLTFSEQSTNTSQNSSTLSYSLILTKSAGYAWNMAQCQYRVTLNGSVIKSGTTSYDFRNYKSLTLTSGETTVTHNSDGTGSCTFSGYFNGDNHTAGLEVLTTPTETLTLTTIDRSEPTPTPTPTPTPDPDPEEDVTPGSPIIDLPGEHLSKKILMLDLSGDFDEEIEDFQNVLNSAVSTYGDALNAARENLVSKQEILDQLRRSGTATDAQIAAAEENVAIAQLAVNSAQADYDKVYSEASFMEYVPTSTELLTHANTFIAENDLTTPEVNLTLDFYQLSNLKDRVDLGDTVSVYFERLGVSATAKCIKTTWNVLLDRYEEIELGSVKASISDTLAGTTQAVQQQQAVIYNTVAEVNRTVGKVDRNLQTLENVKLSSESAVKNADKAQAAAEEASAKADAASAEAELAGDNASAAALAASAAQDAADAAQAAADAVAENVAEQQGRLDEAEATIDEHAESIQGLQSIVGDTGEWSAEDTIAQIFKDQQTAINQNAHAIESSASSVTVTKLDAAQVASDLAAANGNVDEARLALQQTIDAADDAAVNAAAASGYATQARTAATTARAAADDAYDDWQDAIAELEALIQGGGTPEQIAEAEAAVATAEAAYNAADASADEAETEATRAEAVATETAAISARADAQVTAARAAVTAAQAAADAAAADRASLLARISTAETNITQNSQAIALKASQTDLTLLDDRKNQIFTGTTTPVDPQVGDLWFKSQNEPILTYVDQNGTQRWVEFNKYTDDSTANGVANNLANNYYTKTQTDAAFVVQAESITSTVASTYATISSVNTLSDTVDDAVDLANAKGRVFTTTPTPPYNIGDLWVQGSNGDIFKCKVAKAEGQTYASTDWDRASKYTDDTAANAVANNLANNYYTKTQTNSQIEQTASSITSSVTELVENIQIGGRNLLLDSETMLSWGRGANAFLDSGVVTLQGTTANWGALLNTTKFDGALFDGTTTYVWSFEYKSAASCYICNTICGCAASVYSPDFTRTKYQDNYYTLPSTGGVWKKYVFPARTISQSDLNIGSGSIVSGYFSIYARTNDVSIQIRHFKFEKGTNATDWTPAEEDTRVGNPNLLLDTKKDAGQSHTTYVVADYNFTEHLVANELYTVSAKINTSSDKRSISFHHSGGSYNLTSPDWLPRTNNGIYRATFTATADMAAQTSGLGYGYCRVYASNNDGPQGSTTLSGTANVEWIQLERGPIATDWSPAPQDHDTYTDNAIRSQATATTSQINQLSDRITSTVTTINNVQNNMLTTSDVQALINAGNFATSSSVTQTSSALQVQITQAQNTANSANTTAQNISTGVTVDANGVTVGKSNSAVKGVFTNNSLQFQSGGKAIAWLSANSEEGLGVDTIQIGKQNTANQRWIISTSSDGSHLTFTRHQ